MQDNSAPIGSAIFWILWEVLGKDDVRPESGELDVQIESASIKLREGFGKELQKLRKVCTTLAKANFL
jgi:hypothetical protein